MSCYNFEKLILQECKGKTPRGAFKFFKGCVVKHFPNSMLANILPPVPMKQGWRELEDTIRRYSFAYHGMDNPKLHAFANDFIFCIYKLRSSQDQKRRKARNAAEGDPFAGGKVQYCASCWRFVFLGWGGNRRTPLCPEHVSTSKRYKWAKRAAKYPGQNSQHESRIKEIFGEEIKRTNGVLLAHPSNLMLFEKFLQDDLPFTPHQIRNINFQNFETIRDYFPYVTTKVEEKDGDMTDPLSIINTLELAPEDEHNTLSTKRGLLYECLSRDFGLYRFNLIQCEAWERLKTELPTWGGKRNGAGRKPKKGMSGP